MRLMTAHRILIGTAIVASVVFAAWALISPEAPKGTLRWVVAGASLGVGAALVVYLRALRGRV